MATNADATNTQDSSKTAEQTVKISDAAGEQIGDSAATSTTSSTVTSGAQNASNTDNQVKMTESTSDSTTDKKSLLEKASDVANAVKENVTDAAKAAADKSSAILDSVSTSVTTTASSIINDPVTVKTDAPTPSTTEKVADALKDAAKDAADKSSALADSVKTAVTTTVSSITEDPVTVQKDAAATGTDQTAETKTETQTTTSDKPVEDPVTVKTDAPTTSTTEKVADAVKDAAKDAADKSSAIIDSVKTTVTTTASSIVDDPVTVKKETSVAASDKPVEDPVTVKTDAPATTTTEKVVDAIKETAKDAADKSSAVVDSVKDTVKDAAKNVAENSSAAVDAAKDTASDAAKSVAEKSSAVVDAAKTAVTTTASSIVEDPVTVKKDAQATNADKPAEATTEATTEAKKTVDDKPVEDPTILKKDASQSVNQQGNEDESKVTVSNQSVQEKPEEKKVATSTESSANSTTTNGGKDSEGSGNFLIKKDNAKNLTDFQRKKAEYFFNVNFHHDDEKLLTWNEVEDYLLFHITAANKDGPASSELEKKLSRAARGLWEHIFDEIPSQDGKRDQITLDQFLDTWASLIDYIVEHGQLPSVVQDLVDLGFELYSNQDSNAASPSIPVKSFEQLFEKMSLGNPYARMAYKFLTDNGTKPLDKDKVNSAVRAVITSSDDGHPSHFLLPGFFKTLTSKTDKADGKTTPTPPADSQPSTTSPSVAPTNTAQVTNNTTTTATTSNSTQEKSDSSEKPKTEGSSSVSQGTTGGNQSTQPTPPASNENDKSLGGSGSQPSAGGINNLPSVVPQPPKLTVQQLDNQIRNLLHFYHIDDSDVVEVSDGPQKRIVLVHPERPIPAYLQKSNTTVQQLKGPVATPTSSSSTTSQEKTASTESKPKLTLEERVARGEAQVGPTVPLRQEQQVNQNTSTGIKQVFPPPGTQEAQGEDKLATVAPASTSEDSSKSKGEESAKEAAPSAEEKAALTAEEEKKIVEAIIKKITPLVEELVASEIRRIRHGGKIGDDDDDDVGGFVPFPIIFGGGPMFAQQGSGPVGVGGGMSGGSPFIPPEILMNMMNDLTRGNMGEGFPANGPPPPQASRAGPYAGPAGVEGFMMFASGNSSNAGPAPFRPPY